MKKIFIFLFTLSLGFTTQAQSIFFPKTWLGQWKGTLQIATNTGNVTSVAMQLVLEPSKKPGQYYLSIIYSNAVKDDVRNYT